MANPLIGDVGASPVSIYATTTEQTHPTGTRGYLADGRVFYWACNKTAAALTRGEVQVRVDPVAEHVDEVNDTLVVGSKAVVFTPAAAGGVADLYAEGYLVVNDGGGEGGYYKVRSHAAITASTAFTVNLYDEVAVVSSAATNLTLVHNAYMNPQQSNVDQLDVVVGVPPTTIAAGDTTPQYGWLQTWGECPVLHDATVAALGEMAVVSETTAGAVTVDATATTLPQMPIVGRMITLGVSTEYNPIDLMIRP